MKKMEIYYANKMVVSTFSKPFEYMYKNRLGKTIFKLNSFIDNKDNVDVYNIPKVKKKLVGHRYQSSDHCPYQSRLMNTEKNRSTREISISQPLCHYK